MLKKSCFMKRRAMMLAVLALAGCAGLRGFNSNLPAAEIGYLPADAFGDAIQGEDPAIAATNAATYAFAHPGAMQGQPAEMALAVASLEAMAGQFVTGGRWSDMDNTAKLQMLDARAKVRVVLGVAPTANCQDVIDGLVGAAQAIKRGDAAGAKLAVAGPAFTKGPEATLNLLAHFPPVPAANVATVNASRYLYPAGGNGFGMDM
ncbi:MAG TPA: hypothetical protein PLT25_11530 [Acidocella sp.]|nr:hypothetical protein [Acidocella sp.]